MLAFGELRSKQNGNKNKNKKNPVIQIFVF